METTSDSAWTRFQEAVKDGERGFVDRLLKYLSWPTISAQNVGIREGAQVLCEAMTRASLKAEIIETPFHPVVVGKSAMVTGRRTILWYGHYDVQPAEPLDQWVTPPFEPRERDGRIYARGAGDNKGQHFAFLMALETLAAMGESALCNIIMVVDGEEEIGSPGLPSFVQKHAELLGQADLVVVADGSMHPSGNPLIQFGVRGVVAFELKASGANRDLHSGNFGNVAPNPAWDIVHLLSTMKNSHGDITVEGLHDAVVAPTEAEEAAMKRIPLDVDSILKGLDLERLDEPQELSYFHRLMFRPTLTINGLSSGYSGEGAKTIIPATATAKCDIRLVNAQEPEHVLRCLKAHVRKHAPNVTLVRSFEMAPAKTPMDSPIAMRLSRAIEKVHGKEPYLYPTVGGSLLTSVFSKDLGLPTFVVPYANHDQRNHSPNENICVKNFLDGIKTSAAILMELAKTDE